MKYPAKISKIDSVLPEAIRWSAGANLWILADLSEHTAASPCVGVQR